MGLKFPFVFRKRLEQAEWNITLLHNQKGTLEGNVWSLRKEIERLEREVLALRAGIKRESRRRSEWKPLLR